MKSLLVLFAGALAIGCSAARQPATPVATAAKPEGAAVPPAHADNRCDENRGDGGTTQPPVWPGNSAKEGDVATIDRIVAAVYDTISGPSSQARDWDRFRGLFAPGARLIPTGSSPAGGRLRALTVDDYVSGFRNVLEREPEGFFEVEVARRVERFDRVAHVFSTYETRKTPDGEAFARGINSVQLFFDDTRWWVVTIYWAAERPGVAIPEKYQAGSG